MFLMNSEPQEGDEIIKEGQKIEEALSALAEIIFETWTELNLKSDKENE